MRDIEMKAGQRVGLGMLALMLALAALAGPPGGVQALSAADPGSTTVAILLSQSVAKTNDTVGVTFSGYWTNTTYVIRQGANNTTTMTPQVTRVPSPGPIRISIRDSQGKDIIGTSGIHNLTNGLYSISFLVTPAFGLDTITFYAQDLYTNVSAQPVALQVDYSEAQRLADARAAIDYANVVIQANDQAQQNQRWFDFWLQAGIQWVLVVGALLAVTYRVQKRAGQNTWLDVLRRRHGLTSVVNPMRHAAHPVRTKTLNVPAEIAALETLYRKRRAIEVLTEMRNVLDEVREDDLELKHLEGIIRQARTSLGLRAMPEVKHLVTVE